MTAISKNVYFDVLDDIVDEYNNTYHRTIKMKPIDVKPDSYAEYNVNSNEKNPKFEVRDYVRISNYKNIFAKGYAPNWSEKVFVISKIKNTVPIPCRSFERNNKVELDLSIYTTKLELNEATGIDTSNFALKSNLAGLKTEVHKIDVDKLKTVPVNLSKLSNVVNNDVVKKTSYNKLVTKDNNIDIGGFILKTKYDTDKSDLENKISDAEKKIPGTRGLTKKQIQILKLLK